MPVECGECKGQGEWESRGNLHQEYVFPRNIVQEDMGCTGITSTHEHKHTHTHAHTLSACVRYHHLTEGGGCSPSKGMSKWDNTTKKNTDTRQLGDNNKGERGNCGLKNEVNWCGRHVFLVARDIHRDAKKKDQASISFARVMCAQEKRKDECANGSQRQQEKTGETKLGFGRGGMSLEE